MSIELIFVMASTIGGVIYAIREIIRQKEKNKQRKRMIEAFEKESPPMSRTKLFKTKNQ